MHGNVSSENYDELSAKEEVFQLRKKLETVTAELSFLRSSRDMSSKFYHDGIGSSEDRVQMPLRNAFGCTKSIDDDSDDSATTQQRFQSFRNRFSDSCEQPLQPPPLPPRLHRPPKPERTFAHTDLQQLLQASAPLSSLNNCAINGSSHSNSNDNNTFRLDTPPVPRRKTLSPAMVRQKLSPSTLHRSSQQRSFSNSLSAIPSSVNSLAASTPAWNTASTTTNNIFRFPPNNNNTERRRLMLTAPMAFSVSNRGSKTGEKPDSADSGSVCEDLAPDFPEASLLDEIEKKCSQCSDSLLFKFGPSFLYFNADGDQRSTTVSRPSRCAKLLASYLYDQCLDGRASIALCLSGESGSGKSSLCASILAEVLMTFGGRKADQSELYKALTALDVVLSSCTCAKAPQNRRQSQAALLYEPRVSSTFDLYRISVQACFADESRVVRRIQGENYVIFYLMMAGLSADEKAKFHLSEHTTASLNYLNGPIDGNDSEAVSEELRASFLQWKVALATLGVPISDVLRILSAILLLGNLKVREPNEAAFSKELETVCALLGVQKDDLAKALTTSVTKVGGSSMCTETSTSFMLAKRDILAMTLFHHCISAILRRFNDLRFRSAVQFGTSSTTSVCSRASSEDDSASSSIHDSGIGLTLSLGKSSATSTTDTNTDSVISVLDMLGLRNEARNRFEDVCANVAAERMQRCFQEILHSSCKADLDTVPQPQSDINSDLVDLLLSPACTWNLNHHFNSTNFSTNCELRLQIEDLSKKHPNRISCHSSSSQKDDCFVVRHFGTQEQINYDYPKQAEKLTVLSPELVQIFDRDRCNFSFASHLFDEYIRQINNGPTLAKSSQNGNEQGSFSCTSFGSQIRSFERQIRAQATSIFVLCVKPNRSDQGNKRFDREYVSKQLHRLDVPLLQQLVSKGLPFSYTLTHFNRRYQFLLRRYQCNQQDRPSIAVYETRAILDCYLKAVDDSHMPYTCNHWLIERTPTNQNILLSRGAIAQLETLRTSARDDASRRIQRWTKTHVLKKASCVVSNISRRRPIVCCAAEDTLPKCLANAKIVQPLPLPPPRSYYVDGHCKILLKSERDRLATWRV